MIEDGVRADKRIAQANDYVRGALDDHQRSRAERDLAYDPAFQAKVIALADRLKPAAFDQQVLDRLPAAVDHDWRRRTRALSHLGQRRSPAMRVFWPANDRGRSGMPLHLGRTPSQALASTTFVAFAAGLLITSLAMIALNPQVLPRLLGFFS